MFTSGKSAAEIVEARGLKQVSDEIIDFKSGQRNIGGKSKGSSEL